MTSAIVFLLGVVAISLFAVFLGVRRAGTKRRDDGGAPSIVSGGSYDGGSFDGGGCDGGGGGGD
jgi:uncharacterized membrane protein YgcG